MSGTSPTTTASARNKGRVIAGICLLLLVFGLAGSARALLTPAGSQVEIVQDGQVLYTLDLAQAEDQTIAVDYAGRVNLVQVAAGRVRVLAADCPDQTCVHMGWLESSALPIICLPNRLVVRFSDQPHPGGGEPAADAVTR